MSEKVVAGIDYSMRSPAICMTRVEDGTFKDDDLQFFGAVHTKNVPTGTNVNMARYDDIAFPEYQGDDIKRFANIMRWSMDAITDYAEFFYGSPVSYVFIEDYAYSRSGRTFHIGENTGILKYELWKNRFPYMVIESTAIKKYATGKGTATKNKMYDCFVECCSLDIVDQLDYKKSGVTNPLEDVVDAYWIMRYGIDYMNG